MLSVVTMVKTKTLSRSVRSPNIETVSGFSHKIKQVYLQSINEYDITATGNGLKSRLQWQLFRSITCPVLTKCLTSY